MKKADKLQIVHAIWYVAYLWDKRGAERSTEGITTDVAQMLGKDPADLFKGMGAKWIEMAWTGRPSDWKPEDSFKMISPPVSSPTLNDADPDCAHIVVDNPDGGIKCAKCPGWFRFDP